MTIIQVTIDRTSLSLDDLVIEDTEAAALSADGLAIVEWNEGGWEAENSIAQSRWTDGGILTSSRRKMVQLDGVVRVYGSTRAILAQNYDALMNALNQFGYEITLTFADGGDRAYTCLPANTKPVWTREELRAKQATVEVQIPRQP